MDITKFINYCEAVEGSQTDAFRLYFSDDCNKIKASYYNILHGKYTKPKEIKELKKCIAQAFEIKKKCAEIGGDEDQSSIQFLVSELNPLILFIVKSKVETKGKTYNPNRFDINQLHIDINPKDFNVTTYDDELSMMAPNGVQRAVQQAMNLIIIDCRSRLPKLPKIDKYDKMIETTFRHTS